MRQVYYFMGRGANRVQSFLRVSILVVLIGMLWGVPVQASGLSGLMALKAMAQDAVPYERAIGNHKPMFLEFYADWCSTCQTMAPTMRQLHDEYEETVNFVMLNIDDPQWFPQIEEYQVQSIPQVILLDGNQAEVKTWVGQVPAPILSEALAQLSTSPVHN